jgi:hypothetical protein
MQAMSISKCLENLDTVFLLFGIFYLALIGMSCGNFNKEETGEKDSVEIYNSILEDPSLRTGYLNYYTKNNIPIAIKQMRLKTEMAKAGFKTDFTQGNYNPNDTLYIFSGIVSRDSSTARVVISIPSEGLEAKFYLLKSKKTWQTISDSTDIAELK